MIKISILIKDTVLNQTFIITCSNLNKSSAQTAKVLVTINHKQTHTSNKHVLIISKLYFKSFH